MAGHHVVEIHDEDEVQALGHRGGPRCLSVPYAQGFLSLHQVEEYISPGALIIKQEMLSKGGGRLFHVMPCPPVRDPVMCC